MDCICEHGRADHSSNDCDITGKLGRCLLCSCKKFATELPTVSGGKDGNPPDRYALAQLTGNPAIDLPVINTYADQGYRFEAVLPFNYVLMGNYKENK